jgi:NAD(P)-dependent dehydrogenase (short-subunit alcohol dehydrogenase family)
VSESEGDHVVVITGAGGGMGLATVRTLSTSGLLVLADISDERLGRANAVAAEVGARAVAVRCDVTNSSDVARLAEVVCAEGSFGGLVHTAGVSPQMADGRHVLEVDLVGTARVLDALGPAVGPGSAAVCVGSIAGYAPVAPEVESLLDDPLDPGFLDAVGSVVGEGFDGATGYVLAKRGVMRLCERVAGSWGRRGGRVVSVSPGLMDTEMGRLELEHTPTMEVMVEATPVKRPGVSSLPGRPEDIAELAAFLCSERASFISGCDIRVDGGLVGASRAMGFAG